MTYRVLFIDQADVVGEYRSLDEARERLRDYLAAHPQFVDEMGILPIDADGLARDQMITGEDVVGQQTHFPVY